MIALDEALMFNGITPPAPFSRKTTCPACSHKRDKRDEKCLSVYPDEGWVDWKCHHCGWESGDAVA